MSEVLRKINDRLDEADGMLDAIRSDVNNLALDEKVLDKVLTDLADIIRSAEAADNSIW